MLREDQIRRYSRHILLPDVGGIGQARLLAADVAVDLTDDPAAATVAAVYLTAAGIGTLRLPGAEPSLVADLAALNPDVTVLTNPRHPPPSRPDFAPGPPSPGVPLPAIAGSEVADALVRGGLLACGIVHGIATGR